MQKEFDKIMEGLIPREETALFAVSGGIDSMCMAELAYRGGWKMAVAHCNFHLRGEESDGDEVLVREWAESHGIPFHRVDFDTEAYSRKYSVSIEMAARDLRYDWFLEICEANGYQALAVAHNANDNAETLILNLLRGTGLRGLTGMRADGFVPAPGGEKIRMIRPLLDFSRKEIEDFAASAGVSYREDHTNRETVYKRNKLRHNVFPVFEEINPSFLRTFAREMEVFAVENDIAEEYFLLADVTEPVSEGERLRVNVDKLLAARHWEYVLFRLVEKYGFRDRLLEPVVRLLKSGGTLSGKVFEAPGFRLMTEPGRLVIREFCPEGPSGVNALARSGCGMPPRMLSRILSEDESCSAVRTDGKYEFDGICFSVSTEEAGADPVGKARHYAGRGVVSFDAAVLKMPFVVRTWRNGDWMRPLGMKGKRKLSDIFTDLKLGREAKSRALVVVAPGLPGSADDSARDNEKAGERVAAVCGYASGSVYCRVDDSAKVTASTSKIVKLEICPPYLTSIM